MRGTERGERGGEGWVTKKGGGSKWKGVPHMCSIPCHGSQFVRAPCTGCSVRDVVGVWMHCHGVHMCPVEGDMESYCQWWGLHIPGGWSWGCQFVCWRQATRTAYTWRQQHPAHSWTSGCLERLSLLNFHQHGVPDTPVAEVPHSEGVYSLLYGWERERESTSGVFTFLSGPVSCCIWDTISICKNSKRHWLASACMLVTDIWGRC